MGYTIQQASNNYCTNYLNKYLVLLSKSENIGGCGMEELAVFLAHDDLIVTAFDVVSDSITTEQVKPVSLRWGPHCHHTEGCHVHWNWEHCRIQTIN